MDGVDQMGWFVQKYRISIKSKKWYFPSVTNALDVELVNSWILYNLSAKACIPLLDFHQRIALAYLQLRSPLSDPKTRGRLPFQKRVLSKKVPSEISLAPKGFVGSRSRSLSVF